MPKREVAELRAGLPAAGKYFSAVLRHDDLKVLGLDVRRAVGGAVVLSPQPRQVAPQRGPSVRVERGEGAQRRPVPFAEEVNRLLRRQRQAEGDRAAVEMQLGGAVSQALADGRLVP